MTVSYNSLLQRIAEGESDILDFKKTISSAPKIAKTLAAFANTRGGSLLIGVTDSGRIVGTRVQDEMHVLEGAAAVFCDPEIPIVFREHPVKDKIVLEVKVPESTHKPHYAKDTDGQWYPYIRVRDNSVLASKLVVDVIRKESENDGALIQYSSKEQALLQYLEENDRITLKQYCRLVNISYRRARRILVDMVTAGVIRLHTTEKSDFFTLA